MTPVAQGIERYERLRVYALVFGTDLDAALRMAATCRESSHWERAEIAAPD